MNGFRFHTIEREKYGQTQNSGVVVIVYEDVKEEDNVLVESDVFQKEEQSAYYDDLQHHRSLEASAIGSSTRIRTDTEAFQVDTLQVVINVESNQIDATFINNYTSDEDDDTFIDYCNDEEDQLSTNDDIDIDELWRK
ncbi:hypothetical protein F0562_001630 [Nyssa sinensis]|uniref:Uncharacterized protein n=1 Tax=Nyssa sinensis TaxID=561372 RepID=A0A5J5C7P4_9ASTE|nr:hypothetical protein F0562_001630 [Nyssa sinensis]